MRFLDPQHVVLRTLAVAFLGFAAAASAEQTVRSGPTVFKSVDQSGRVTYSDVPPVDARQIDVMRVSPRNVGASLTRGGSAAARNSGAPLDAAAVGSTGYSPAAPSAPGESAPRQSTSSASSGGSSGGGGGTGGGVGSSGMSASKGNSASSSAASNGTSAPKTTTTTAAAARAATSEVPQVAAPPAPPPALPPAAPVLASEQEWLTKFKRGVAPKACYI